MDAHHCAGGLPQVAGLPQLDVCAWEKMVCGVLQAGARGRSCRPLPYQFCVHGNQRMLCKEYIWICCHLALWSKELQGGEAPTGSLIPALRMVVFKSTFDGSKDFLTLLLCAFAGLSLGRAFF